MRKFLIITINKKLFLLITFILISVILTYSLFININHIKTKQTSSILNDDEAKKLIKENNRLREILERIMPEEQNIMYENPYRLYGDVTIDVKSTSIKKVIEKGKTIDFKVTYKIPEYLRPTYDPTWVMGYYRGWIDLVPKVEESRHRLFIFPLGASSSYNFTNSLGFHGNPRVDAHRNINFLIYHFEVEDVKVLGRQIALIGKSKRTGVEVIAVNKDYLFNENEGKGDFLIQLSTPSGHEIDFIYEKNVMKYEYLMKEIEKHRVKSNVPLITVKGEPSLEELKKENKLLKEKLSIYVPIYEEEIISERECIPWPSYNIVGRTYDINNACEKGTELDYKIHYQNHKYVRPIYHPAWKKHSNKGWAYIPDKICENLHTIFNIPINSSEQLELFGKLAFFEEYSSISNDRIGFLIYNFKVNKVYKYNNQIVITGVPSRTGAEIISLERSSLLKKKSYLIQMSTTKCIETDYNIVTVE